MWLWRYCCGGRNNRCEFGRLLEVVLLKGPTSWDEGGGWTWLFKNAESDTDDDDSARESYSSISPPLEDWILPLLLLPESMRLREMKKEKREWVEESGNKCGRDYFDCLHIPNI